MDVSQNPYDLDDDLYDDEDTQKDKYLTFHIGTEDYGISIAYVTEIIGIQNITEIPEMPDFIKGVINLRGKVIPVMDVRTRFKLPPREYDERTCIIVVEIEGQAGPVQIGIVVDAVSEVLNIKGEEIEDAPTFGTKLDIDYILGMAKMEGGVKILLDIGKVLSAEATSVLEKAA